MQAATTKNRAIRGRFAPSPASSGPPRHLIRRALFVPPESDLETGGRSRVQRGRSRALFGDINIYHTALRPRQWPGRLAGGLVTPRKGSHDARIVSAQPKDPT